MIPNRAQFVIHGMVSLSLILFMPTNQIVSATKLAESLLFSASQIVNLALAFLRSAKSLMKSKVLAIKQVDLFYFNVRANVAERTRALRASLGLLRRVGNP